MIRKFYREVSDCESAIPNLAIQSRFTSCQIPSMRSIGWLLIALAACGEIESKSTLTVELTGTGTVTSEPAGISCPGTCSAEFEFGAEVTLSAAADSANAFTGWPERCAGRGACAVKLETANVTVDAAFAPEGTKRWLTSAGERNSNNVTSMSGLGPTIGLLGSAGSQMMFAGTSIERGGAFIAKLDPAGQAAWAKTLNREGLNGAVQADTLVVDPAGAIVVTGNIIGTIDVGTGPIVADSNDIFLAKYAADGALVWVKTFGGPRGDYGTAVAVGADGDVYLVGTFEDSVNFGGGVRTRQSTVSDGFVARFRGATGDYVWDRQLASTPATGDFAGVYGLAIDPTGTLAIVGGFKGRLLIGGVDTELFSEGESDGFLATLDAQTGQARFSKRQGGSMLDRARRITTDRDDNLYVVGEYQGAAEAGGPPLPAGNLFIAKYSRTGSHQWSRGIAADSSTTLAVDSLGDVVVAGGFQGTLDLGDGVTFSAQGGDAFVAKLGGERGAALWAKQFGGADSEYSRGVAVDDLDRIYVSGNFSGFVEFDGETLTAKTTVDIFMISFGP